MAPEGRLEESLLLEGVAVVDESVESRRSVLVASDILTLRRSLMGLDRFSEEGLPPEDEAAKLTPVGEKVLDDDDEVAVFIPPCSRCTAFEANT